MKFAMILTAGAILATAQPALAQGACQRPSAPAAVDGATASLDQLIATKNATAAFIGASDAYQTCVLADLAAQRAAAKEAKTKFDSSIADAAQAQISANQSDKEAAGAAFNAAAKAYKAAHPS